MPDSDKPRDPAEIDAWMRQFASYMRKKRLKSTEQRDVIARVFFETRGHVNIEELLAKSRVELPSIGYATVYRTLRLLTECGLAAMRRFGEGGTVFEAAGDTAHHDHLICVECGHVLEFENDEIEKLQEQVARSFGFNLVRHKLELYGMCPKARGIRGGSCPHDEELAAKRANGEASPAPRPITRGEPLRGSRAGRARPMQRVEHRRRLVDLPDLAAPDHPRSAADAEG